MKFEINILSLLHKLRILFFLGVFYAIYTYVAPVFAFMVILYFLWGDISDIETDVEEQKKRGEQMWRNISVRRKDF